MSFLQHVVTLGQAPEPTPTDIGEVTERVTEEVGNTVYDAGPYVGPLIALGIAFVSAAVVTLILTLVLRQALRKRPRTREASMRMRLPAFLATFLMVGRTTLGQVPIEGVNLLGIVQWVMLFAGLGCIAWLLINAVRTGETSVLVKYADASVTDRRARKLKTQTVLIRRILVVVIVVLAISAVMLTIPAVRAVGAGIVASAGILSVIAGLAVQSSLANVFAGLQIVFTDALRVGDVVQVEEYFGTVEDITLSYVVLKIWDERRVIYPSTFFTTNPFENYTRTGSSAFGTVELEVDWAVPVEAMRRRLAKLVESTPLWDGRDRSIQVTEALGGMVKVRIVVSAENTGNLWDLRTLVREDMINFLRTEYPESIYRQRFATEDSAKHPTRDQSSGGKLKTLDDVFAEGTAARGSMPKIGREKAPLSKAGDGQSMFTGSITALERGRDYLGPGEDAYRERIERAADDPEDALDDQDELEEPEKKEEKNS